MSTFAGRLQTGGASSGTGVDGQEFLSVAKSSSCLTVLRSLLLGNLETTCLVYVRYQRPTNQ